MLMNINPLYPIHLTHYPWIHPFQIFNQPGHKIVI